MCVCVCVCLYKNDIHTLYLSLVKQTRWRLVAQQFPSINPEDIEYMKQFKFDAEKQSLDVIKEQFEPIEKVEKIIPYEDEDEYEQFEYYHEYKVEELEEIEITDDNSSDHDSDLQIKLNNYFKASPENITQRNNVSVNSKLQTRDSICNESNIVSPHSFGNSISCVMSVSNIFMPPFKSQLDLIYTVENSEEELNSHSPPKTPIKITLDQISLSTNLSNNGSKPPPSASSMNISFESVLPMVDEEEPIELPTPPPSEPSFNVEVPSPIIFQKSKKTKFKPVIKQKYFKTVVKSKVKRSLVNRISEQQWEHMNGNYDKDGIWRNFSEMTSAYVINGEGIKEMSSSNTEVKNVLHILPYVNFSW